MTQLRVFAIGILAGVFITVSSLHAASFIAGIYWTPVKIERH